MIDLKKEKKRLDEAIKAKLDPLFASKGFKWNKNNFWTRDVGWHIESSNLGFRKISSGLYCDLIGGVGLFLPEYHKTLGIESETTIAPYPTTIGGPIHWIDKRLDFDSGRFTTFEEFEAWLPLYHRAFDECAIPELSRYQTEDMLLEALLQSDWLKSVKISMSQDRRGALVALMLAKREGAEKGLAWAMNDVARIKAQEPDQERPGRWRDLQRAIDYLSAR